MASYNFRVELLVNLVGMEEVPSASGFGAGSCYAFGNFRVLVVVLHLVAAGTAGAAVGIVVESSSVVVELLGIVDIAVGSSVDHHGCRWQR